MSEDDLFWFFSQLFAGLNGLLLPGGSAPLVGPGGYAEVGMIFFQLAKEVKKPFFLFHRTKIWLKGDFWGFCNPLLPYLPPLRFHCVGGCWNRIQNCYG
jgi:hypothetical protein